MVPAPWFIAAFVGFLGILRLRGGRVDRAALVLLVLNTAGGIEVALASALKPFSQAQATAQWIEQEDLEGAFWIGTPDFAVLTVAGYLGRPFHVLECACEAEFVRWHRRREGVAPDSIPDRVRAALVANGLTEGYVIAGTHKGEFRALENQSDGVRFEFLVEMAGGMVVEEDFRLYRVRLGMAGSPGEK